MVTLLATIPVILAALAQERPPLPAEARRALETRGGAALALRLPGSSPEAFGSATALDEPHATGSVIKPLTALIALESGAMTPQTEILCRREVRAGGAVFRCAHATVLLPLRVSEALALSCNYFFAEAGRRVGREALEKGFRQAGIEVEASEPAVVAIGGRSVRATPRQLLTWFASLALGRVPFRAENVVLVRRALEAAVRDGTAAPAAIEETPGGASTSKDRGRKITVAGKTGTVAESAGVSFRTSGWFAGWAPSEQPRLVTVVWLRRGDGRDAAALAGKIFRSRLADDDTLRVELFSSVALARLTIHPPGNTPPLLVQPGSNRVLDCPSEGCRLEVQPQPPGRVLERRVQGRLGIETVAGSLRVLHLTALEDYVAGVLAGEVGGMRHPEPLKAMAVAARTFALRHRGRHAKERPEALRQTNGGFDFCSLTHCQVYTNQAPEPRFREAVSATAGQTVRFRGELIRAYYTGACGGHTQAAGNVWPEEAAPYLPAQRDPYCATAGANHPWSTRLPAAQLEATLRSDRVADPGGPLRSLDVLSRDSSGRALQVRINGSRVRLVNANYLRFLVGRRLGWEKLKSTAFNVRRDGGDFVFEGRGFGHGVGLCQEGAARMGEAGSDYGRILAHYYPGAEVAGGKGDSFASENFTVTFPAGRGADAREAAKVMEAARRHFTERGVPAPGGRVEVTLHESAAAFTAATGKPGWVSAATDGKRLNVQPLAVLRARNIVKSTLSHEYLHLALRDATDPRIPNWFREGVALFLGAENPGGSAGPGPAMTLEQAIARPRSREQMRRAYARALEETRAIAGLQGHQLLLRILRQPEPAELKRLAAVGRKPL